MFEHHDVFFFVIANLSNDNDIYDTDKSYFFLVSIFFFSFSPS